jgi:chromosome segregation ATPase
VTQLQTKIEKKDNQLRKLIAAEEDMKTRTKDAEDRLAETKAKSRVKADLDEQNIKRLTDDLHTSRYEHDKTSAELEACKAEVLSLHVAQNDLREAKAESEESLHAKIAEWTAKYQDREATVVQVRVLL